MKSNRMISLFGLTAATSLVLAACASPTPTPAPKPAEPAKPAAPATAAPAAAAPAAAPAGKRGSGGTLRILYWQAPTILNSYLASGTKDYDAARLIQEPLAAVGPDGSPIPILAAEIPTEANGGISKDKMSITWKIKPGVKWHDGTDLTAADLLFSYEYCINKETGCTNISRFNTIDKIEAVNPLTVKITWKQPSSYPYTTFVSSNGYVLQKKQFEKCIGAAASKDADCQKANNAPIGTGPYKLRDFKSGDTVTYDVNVNYHMADKPFFKEVIFKGGGDAPSAARAVFQTGDTDYAWNLQVEAAVLAELQKGGKGELNTSTGSNVERIMYQTTDISPEAGDKRGEMGTQHPFFSDVNVRKAFSMVIDRKTMAESLYGPAGGPTCELITWAPYVSSDKLHGGRNDCTKQDFDAAGKLLDDAGWKKGADGIREKGGKKMKVIFQTSVNALRQKEQALMKDAWNKLGVDVELKAVDAGVYFGAGPSSNDNIAKFFADIQMYTNGSGVTEATDYICGGFESTDISQKANNWGGSNNARYKSDAFDKICAELRKETDPAKSIELAMKANDQLIYKDWAISPLVARKNVSGIAKDLKGVKMSPWDSEMYNIFDWTK